MRGWLRAETLSIAKPCYQNYGNNMVKNKYQHFNPVEHKIASKIATVRTSHHCKYKTNYHIIWIPKYRKQILKNVKINPR
ncbi:hypothetical protein GF323_04885 [Candidatus Woesearchaeota archaeon]|nr:hypothetical protein [Candidatus Woesearchaeota archaeon]